MNKPTQRLKGDGAAGVEALLNPRNVVIAGASEKPGNWAQRVWRNLQRYGYEGPVYPFNPTRDRIWDTRCYTDFADLPEPPDHVVMLVPAKAVPDLLEKAAAAGARSATVMTAGFEEATDGDGATLTAQLHDVLARTGIAISGPNCLGNVSARARLVTMPDDRPQTLVEGPVAVIAQSGGIGMAIKRTLEERGVNCGAVITSGNEAGLSTSDYISYFADDPGTRIIACYLEAVHDSARFLAACAKARAAGKPIVVMKLGASPVGRAAAAAHTGSLAGNMAAFDAVAHEAGVIRVPSLDEMIETVEFLIYSRLPAGPRLGAITFSGAMRGLLMDAAAGQGLEFRPLSPTTRARLESVLAVGTIIGNPLDSGFAALTSADAYTHCVKAFLDDPEIDMLLLQEEIPRAPGTERKEQNLRNVEALVEASGKAVSYVSMISYGMTDYSRELRKEFAHLPFLQEIEKTMRTVRRIVDYAEARKLPEARARLRPVALPAAMPAEPGKPAVLSEQDSKAVLAPFGLRTPAEASVHSADDAAAAAARIGYPVVMKLTGVAHKTELGGVLLNLGSEAAVRAGFDTLIGRMRGAGVDLSGGVIVAEQMTGGVELSLGITTDPEVGKIIMFGSGGTALELYQDVAFAALPLDAARAGALIDRTRAAGLIAGFRGGPPLDREAAIAALVALSDFAVSAGDAVREVDINPFLLTPKGGVVLDALIVPAEAAGEQENKEDRRAAG